MGDPGAECAGALDRPAALGAHVAADQRQGDLVGEQLIVGQTLAGRGFRQQCRLAVRRVRRQQRRFPRLPFVARHVLAVGPFFQFRHRFQRAFDGAAEHLLRQPGSQRIDRFHGLEFLQLVQRADMVRMRHLDFVTEALDAARHHPLFALRQGLRQVVLVRVEKHQRQLAAVIGTDHLVGKALVGRFLVLHDAQRDGRDGAGMGVGDFRRVAAVDQPRRQMPEQVDQVRAAEFFDQRANARPDALEGGDGFEQGKQNLRAHGARVLTNGMGARIS